MEQAVRTRAISALSLDAALDALELLQREKAALEAREQRLLARLDVLDRVENPETRWTRESVSSILRCAPVTAQHKLTMAGVLVAELPATLDALEAGRLTPGHVRVVLDAVTVLDPEATAALEARVLPQAESLSVAEFRKRCTRAVLTVDPDGAERRHDAALDQRRVEIHSAENGMADLYAHLSGDEAARIRQHLDACLETRRRAHPDDERGVDALRADVLVELCTGNPGDPGRTRPVEVVVAVSTLLGHDELPGEIDGEPAAANLLRILAHDPCAWWRPVLIDRDGHLEAIGARRYRPSALLELTVKLHDRTCQFPGCRRRATRSETDHVIAFDHDNPTAGGPTVLENLHTLCKRHHRLKHGTGWSVTRKDGVTHWRSPEGRRYTKPAHQYLDPAPQPDAPPD